MDKMIGKRTLLLTMLCFFICTGQAGASVFQRSYSYYPNDLATATGTVKAVGLNFIEIYDEEQKRLEKFVYLEQAEEFRQGDYVRIYYHPKSGVVQVIKRMTVLEYKKNGQNLGRL